VKSHPIQHVTKLFIFIAEKSSIYFSFQNAIIGNNQNSYEPEE